MTSYLNKIAQGDKAAVSDFIDCYGGLVWSLARRFTSSEADAEDAVQEIFVELWRKAANFDPQIASESTFTAMVARRRLIDRGRKKKLKNLDAFEFEKLTSASKTAEYQMEISDEASIASDMLNRLPGEQAQAIKLSVYDGLSHSQIAEVTGMSLGTVKSYIRRGLKKLRDQIGFQSVLKSGFDGEAGSP